jgi:hypothetical protein
MRKKLILLSILIVITGTAIVLVREHQVPAASNDATVTLQYNVASTQGVTVTFNGHSIVPSSPNTYLLKPGIYSLAIAGEGYSPFAAHLNLKAQQKFVVSVQLSLNSDSTIQNIAQLNLPNGQNIPGASITAINYFYNQTWAVVSLQAEGSSAVVVVEYSVVADTWTTILGPGTAFTQANSQDLPSKVTDYLIANNYISQGD